MDRRESDAVRITKENRRRSQESARRRMLKHGRSLKTVVLSARRAGHA